MKHPFRRNFETRKSQVSGTEKDNRAAMSDDGKFSDEDGLLDLFDENIRDGDCEIVLMRLANLETKRRNDTITVRELKIRKKLQKEALSHLVHALRMARL